MLKIEVLIKFFLKKLAALLPVNFYQRLLAFSIISNEFSSLQKTKIYSKREELWGIALNLVGQKSLSYAEFGVLEGDSIKYFMKYNSNQDSLFIGLDSFIGLPDDWDSIPSGTLDVEGLIPQIDDKRVAFLKGWFRDSSKILLKKLRKRKSSQLIVNYDADLYSSTLFALTEIDSLKKDYIAIFDEFAGHESRALYNYIQSYNAKVTFIGRTLFCHQPWCVLCKIEPHIPVALKKS